MAGPPWATSCQARQHHVRRGNIMSGAATSCQAWQHHVRRGNKERSSEHLVSRFPNSLSFAGVSREMARMPGAQRHYRPPVLTVGAAVGRAL
jgi:hypothetical protein